MTALPDRVVDQLVAHARRDAPREACGFIYLFAGRYRVVPCHNTSRYPWQGFILGPTLRRRHAVAYGWARPWGVYHSHPAGGLEPSAGDLWGARWVGARFPRLSHFIVDPVAGEVAQISPANAPAR